MLGAVAGAGAAGTAAGIAGAAGSAGASLGAAGCEGPAWAEVEACTNQVQDFTPLFWWDHTL